MERLLSWLRSFFVSLVIVVLCAAAAVVFKPELFEPGTAILKTLKARTPSGSPLPGESPPVSADSLLGQTLRDTVAALLAEIHVQRDRIQELTRLLSLRIAEAESTRTSQRRAFAGLLEAMSPEEAARVLESMDQKEARAVFLRIRKRQAARILSSLDPESVARIAK